MAHRLFKCKNCNNTVAVEKSRELGQCSACGEGRESMNISQWKEITYDLQKR